MESVAAPEALQGKVPEPFVREFGTGETACLLSVDFDLEIVSVDDQRMHVTEREFAVLGFLAANAGKTCTKRDLLGHLYGSDLDQPELKIIDIFICKIRKRLADAMSGHQPIETVWGRGYRFGEPMVEDMPHDTTPRRKVGFVIGPDGAPFTLEGLPPAGTVRWVIRKKAELACAVRGGLLTMTEALTRYPGLTQSEVRSWIALVARYGLAGLRQTAIQQYDL